MKNFNKSIWIGMIASIFTIIVGSALVLMIFEFLAKYGIIQWNSGSFSIQQERTIFVLGIMINLIPFQYFKRSRAEKAMNGVVLMTIAAVVVWIVYYYKSLF
jgi:heme/copper-type cytochrome/quinol oxidase subunit 4